MTLNEFRAWLEGFSASFVDGVPNADQWNAVKAKLEKVAAPVAPAPQFKPNLGALGWPQNEPSIRFQAPPPTAAAPQWAAPNQTVLIS